MIEEDRSIDYVLMDVSIMIALLLRVIAMDGEGNRRV
jgi:hypothetical protein